MPFVLKDGLSYEDALLEPQYSTIKSRSEVDISINLGPFKFTHPIIPANMKTIVGWDMAVAIIKTGGLAILHRFIPINEQVEFAENIINQFDANHFGVSIGIKQEDKDNLKLFNEAGVKIVCIDIAHGDSEQCIEMIKFIKYKHPSMFIIAGNIATGAGAKRLWQAGAHVVKCGIGAGGTCLTRVETGSGVPQLTALMDVATVREKTLREMGLKDSDNGVRNLQFIADGGLKTAGEIGKALCLADMVMAGGMFAGCEETPGNVLKIDGQTFKEYVGSSTHKSKHIEGVEAIVHTKGKFVEILTKIKEGLSSCCSYQGAKNLIELKENPVFIKITSAGLRESHAHSVIVRN